MFGQSHKPSDDRRKQVMMMAGMGLRHIDIGRLVKLDPKTLRKYYRHELDTGMAEANLRVAQSLYHMAVREHIPSAAIFWLKARAGWKDHDVLAIETNVHIGGIDAPPRETMEQWLGRREKELATLEAPARPTNGGDSGPLVP